MACNPASGGGRRNPLKAMIWLLEVETKGDIQLPEDLPVRIWEGHWCLIAAHGTEAAVLNVGTILIGPV